MIRSPSVDASVDLRDADKKTPPVAHGMGRAPKRPAGRPSLIAYAACVGRGFILEDAPDGEGDQ